MEQLKRYFPYFLNNDEIYFDNAATSIKLGTVIDAEVEYLTKINANPHSRDFKNAFLATNILNTTRKKIAHFLNARNEAEVIFTSGTTHALNQVAFGFLHRYGKNKNVVLTTLEHASNVMPWLKLQKDGLLEVRYAPLKANGEIDLKAIGAVVDKNTVFFSFANVSNTIGAKNDPKAIVKTVKSINPQILICVDAAQSVAHDVTDVTDWDVDFVCFSAHKMMGPFGLGVLWAKMSLLEEMQPLLYGGGSNYDITKTDYSLAVVPERFEAGTPNISAIYAFQKVFDFFNDVISIQEIQAREQQLKAYAVKKAKDLKNKNVVFYNLEHSDPMLLFNVTGIPAQDLGTYLSSEHNISVRTGNHCAKMTDELIGCKTTVRATFSFLTSEPDIDKLFSALESSSDHWLDALI